MKVLKDLPLLMVSPIIQCFQSARTNSDSCGSVPQLTRKDLMVMSSGNTRMILSEIISFATERETYLVYTIVQEYSNMIMTQIHLSEYSGLTKNYVVQTGRFIPTSVG